jgi:O-antigen ligase
VNHERLQLGLFAAIAATCTVSIFAAQLFLVLAVLAYAARLVSGRARLTRSPVDGPILAFCVWTLLSAAFARDPLTSHESAKKLVLFALFYLAVDTLAAQKARERVMDAVMLGGIVLAAGAVLQYYFLGFDTPTNRPHSFLGHYMTAAGMAMAVLVIGVARLAFAARLPERPQRRDLLALFVIALSLGGYTVLRLVDVFATESERLLVAALAAAAIALSLARGAWPSPATSSTLSLMAVGLSSWALLVSRTRNAWLGALTGLVVLAVIRAPRALWVLGAAVLLVLVARPAPIIERLTVTDASSRDRYYMWQAGIDMIRDKPVFGQGPGMIQSAYPAYRWSEAPNPGTPHLHDNALQIAAERGLPCLAWWLWLVAAIMGDAYRELRRHEQSSMWAGAAAFALMAAVMVAGLFEYNFGDSEILMLLLLVSALPYALRRERGALPA